MRRLLAQEKDGADPSLKRTLWVASWVLAVAPWLVIGLGIALDWWSWTSWSGWYTAGAGILLGTGVVGYGAGKGAEAMRARRSADTPPPHPPRNL